MEMENSAIAIKTKSSFCECRFCLHQQMGPHPQNAQVPQTNIEVTVCTPTRNTAEMDTLGIEPRAFRMRSGCDTTTPCALQALVPTNMLLMTFRMQQAEWLHSANMRYIRWIKSWRSHKRGRRSKVGPWPWRILQSCGWKVRWPEACRRRPRVGNPNRRTPTSPLALASLRDFAPMQDKLRRLHHKLSRLHGKLAQIHCKLSHLLQVFVHPSQAPAHPPEALAHPFQALAHLHLTCDQQAWLP